MTKNASLFDKRVIDRNIDKGLITQADVAEYLESLPDMEAESMQLTLDSEEDEDTEDTETAEDTGTYNFEAPEDAGPKNVYDF